MLSSELSLGLPFWQEETSPGHSRPYPNFCFMQRQILILKAPCEPEGVCLGPC